MLVILEGISSGTSRLVNAGEREPLQAWLLTQRMIAKSIGKRAHGLLFSRWILQRKNLALWFRQLDRRGENPRGRWDRVRDGLGDEPLPEG